MVHAGGATAAEGPVSMSLPSFLRAGRRSLEAAWESRVEAELRGRPLAAAPLLREEDLDHLPPPVQRFIRRSGAVGRPRVQRFRAGMAAEMFRKPGAGPMPATSEQLNFTASPARLFFMKARMFGLPVQVLHVYAGAAATFQVRLASLVDLVDEKGDVLARAETVTVLNDLCFFAPGALVDPRLAWMPIDERTAAVAFANGPHRVAATLHFDGEDRLVDFTSDDRPALRDGKLVPARWSTPIEAYREVGGLRLPTRGAAVYRYPEGDFTYGRFRLEAIAYDGGPTLAVGP